MLFYSAFSANSVIITKILRLFFLFDFVEFGSHNIDDCAEIAEPPRFYVLFELVFFGQSWFSPGGHNLSLFLRRFFENEGFDLAFECDQEFVVFLVKGESQDFPVVLWRRRECQLRHFDAHVSKFDEILSIVGHVPNECLFQYFQHVLKRSCVVHAPVIDSDDNVRGILHRQIIQPFQEFLECCFDLIDIVLHRHKQRQDLVYIVLQRRQRHIRCFRFNLYHI